MTESTQRQKILWILGTIVVLFYALIPVAWIISLSLKDPTTIGDQKFFPTNEDVGQLQCRLPGRPGLQPRAGQLDRHRADHDR